jgi:hypothetical protein
MFTNFGKKYWYTSRHIMLTSMVALANVRASFFNILKVTWRYIYTCVDICIRKWEIVWFHGPSKCYSFKCYLLWTGILQLWWFVCLNIIFFKGTIINSQVFDFFFEFSVHDFYHCWICVQCIFPTEGMYTAAIFIMPHRIIGELEKNYQKKS